MFVKGEKEEYIVFDAINSYPIERSGDKANYLLEYQLNMDPVKRKVKREAWNFLDFLGLVGGISSSISIIFVLTLDPIADHIFVIEAISTLYLVKQNLYEKVFD